MSRKEVIDKRVDRIGLCVVRRSHGVLLASSHKGNITMAMNCSLKGTRMANEQLRSRRGNAAI